MKITVIGSGYVGLVTGACFSEVGNDVTCLDVDVAKIESLNAGNIPIYEPGLKELIDRNKKAQRLRFTENVQEATEFGSIQFIAVGTPPGEDGSADLKYVLSAARTIGKLVTRSVIVVNKSTVPVGTDKLVYDAIAEELKKRKMDITFSVVSNPEFLKEGAAIDDFMHPDRVIIGSNDEHSTKIMKELYAPFVRNHDRIIVMSTRSAELTKYAANAMLATRISFMNELANLADAVDADIEDIRIGIGSDPRIGYSFLYSGIGYGGSCFPKDVKALKQIGDMYDIDLKIPAAVEEVNFDQKRILCKKITAKFGNDLSNLTFAVWGLSFKPETDDMREAPSLVIIPWLLDRGAKVHAYDPVATKEAQAEIPDHINMHYASSSADTITGADALLLLTEWKEFRTPDFEKLSQKLRHKAIFDGRNIYTPATVRSYGMEYFGIGR